MGSSLSSGFAELIGVRTWGRCGHHWSLGSLGYPLGVVGFIRGCWVYCGALWGSSGSSESAGIIGMRPGSLEFIRARLVH